MRQRVAIPRKGAPRREAAFTLVEAMIVIAILAILATLAVPEFRSLLATMNVKSAAFDLVNDMTTARGEAIKQNKAVTIAANDGGWAKGWKITVAGAVDPIQTRDASRFLDFSGDAAASVEFQPNGRITNATSNSKWLISSSTTGAMRRCVVITPTGSARSIALSPSDGGAWCC